MRRIARLLLWILGGLLAIIIALAAQEMLLYFTRTEASALIQARLAFVKECERNGLDPNEFKGPQRTKRKDEVYEFVWENPSNGDEIIAMTSYLPARSEAWLWRGEERRAIKDRFQIK